jgi:hypothetical protein
VHFCGIPKKTETLCITFCFFSNKSKIIMNNKMTLKIEK